MANKNENAKKKFSIKEYFRGIKIELKKVIWPTKGELISYTGVVIGVCAVCALGFWAVDSSTPSLSMMSRTTSVKRASVK